MIGTGQAYLTSTPVVRSRRNSNLYNSNSTENKFGSNSKIGKPSDEKKNVFANESLMNLPNIFQDTSLTRNKKGTMSRSAFRSRIEEFDHRIDQLHFEDADKKGSFQLDLGNLTVAFKTAIDHEIRCYKRLETQPLRNRLMQTLNFPALSCRYFSIKIERDFSFPGLFRFRCTDSPPVCYIGFDYRPTIDSHLVRHESKEFKVHKDPQNTNPSVLYILCAVKYSSYSQVGICFMKSSKGTPNPKPQTRQVTVPLAIGKESVEKKAGISLEEVESIPLHYERDSVKGFTILIQFLVGWKCLRRSSW